MNTTQMTAALTAVPPKLNNSYLVYVVFDLPKLTAEHMPFIADKRFLLACLHAVQMRNQLHLHDDVAHSHEYFTSLNHSQRYRIPKALKRSNIHDTELTYGILAFQAYRDEPVKNKSFNQRVASINPDIIILERLEAIFAPLSYLCDFSRIGEVETFAQPGFVQVNLVHPLPDTAGIHHGSEPYDSVY